MKISISDSAIAEIIGTMLLFSITNCHKNVVERGKYLKRLGKCKTIMVTDPTYSTNIIYNYKYI